MRVAPIAVIALLAVCGSLAAEEDALGQARKLFYAGKGEAALPICGRVLAGQQSSVAEKTAAALLQGEIHVASGNAEAARAALDRASGWAEQLPAEQRPSDEIHALRLRAQAMAAAVATAVAAAGARLAQAEAAEKAGAAYALGQVCQLYGRAAEAEAAYRHPSLGNSPLAAKAQVALALLYLQRQDHARAEQAAISAACSYPRDSAVAGLLLQLCRTPAARIPGLLAAAAKVSAKCPGTSADKAARLLQVRLLIRVGKRERAANLLGGLLAKQGQVEQAESLRTLAFSYPLPVAREKACNLVARVAHGRGAEAALALVKAEVEGRSGRPVEARAGYEGVVRGWPGTPLAAQAQSVLAGERNARYVAALAALGAQSKEQAKRELLKLWQDSTLEGAHRYLRLMATQGCVEGNRWWAAVELARRLLAQGKGAEARALLEPVAADPASQLAGLAQSLLEQCRPSGGATGGIGRYEGQGFGRGNPDRQRDGAVQRSLPGTPPGQLPA